MAGSSDEIRRGFGHERACRLSNTTHTEVAPCLPLPSLPVFCGAPDQVIRLFDEPTSNARSLNQPEIVAQASRIAYLLRDTDISYLNLRDGLSPTPYMCIEPPSLYTEVLQCNSEAFGYFIPGPVKEESGHDSISEKNSFHQNAPIIRQPQRDCERDVDDHSNGNLINETPNSRKPKLKKKGSDISFSTEPDPVALQDGIIGRFCDLLEDFCGRAETSNDDLDEEEGPSLPLNDLKLLVNEIMSLRGRKILHLVPVDTLVRLLNVLDRQIHRGQGLSLDENENSDADVVSLVMCALESTHASLAIVTHSDMPKQLYKEEIIERILDFSRNQIMECMLSCDPSYRALHRPRENGMFDGDEDEDFEAESGPGSKKRRNFRGVKLKKPTGNKVPIAVYSIVQKLCSILGFLKDLLTIERLSDSCILQLVKTSFATFLADNIQLLQLKAIDLICGVFSSYVQHRNFLIDETFQLLWKMPFSKRAIRSYHLPDEEQRQIQMISALLIQLVQCSANLPEALGQTLAGNSTLEVSVDASYPIKCNEAATEACCLFWTGVLQRFTAVKNQDVSELKVIMENLVMDLLTTLNLPEYPASAPILEVLCVLLLQNAGLKSKDISARCMAIDLLGTVAARLKRDAFLCSGDKFWILREISSEDSHVSSNPPDVCSICLDARGGRNLVVCQGCQRCFHADCSGATGQEVLPRGWSCQLCLCKKQLSVLQSLSKSQCNVVASNTKTAIQNTSEDVITTLEVVQQMLLNYLQEAGSTNDGHLFARWFYLSLWYKDDLKSQEKFIYYIARLKSKAIVRDFGTVSSLLTRESAKRISLALGQKNSFSRGYDKILYMLLASLRENSPVLRAKALRAVSVIVEADPEVLCEKRVQSAVEGRFCDSAISVREAALELVGRHIASHPDVGLKYFEKVAERIKDTGVSVRKRAIKIIRDMCISNSNFSESTNACIEIISRVNDEETSIQDLVCKTFYEFWFEEPSGAQIQFAGDGSSVPLEVAKKTEQVVEVLRRMPNSQLLVTVIRRNLTLDFVPQSAKAIGINAVSLASVRRRCELMCKCLLERILQVDETINEELEVKALPYVLALHSFCTVDPTLCTPASDPSQFVVTLQPYLKTQADNRVVAQLVESIIFIIDSVIPLLRKPPLTVVEELEQDLKQMIVRHSFLTVVHACIRCLCSLSKITGKGATLVEYLIQVFFKRLDVAAADNKQQVGRSLFCLGLLIRYGSELMATSGNQNVHVPRSVSLLKNYLRVEDFGIKVRSLQALGFVLIARPEYMLENDIGKILEATLSSGSDARLKMQSLQNIYEYLLDCESQMGSDHANNTSTCYPGEAGQKVPVAAGAGDTNICGGIIQLYWSNILERCLDASDQVRQSALKIVEVVMRQGLVHPITSVPYLIALETDPQEINSKLAHHLLMNMNEKYPAFFESRLGDGLQMSFGFIQTIAKCSPESSNQNKVPGNMKGKSDGSIFTYSRLGISRIYRLIRGNRISRNKFMSSVVRKFDSGGLNHSAIPFLIYCTEILASLPFTSPDEPLYLIYIINRVIQVRAGALESEMKALSSCSSQGDAAKITQENGAIQNGLGVHLISDVNGIEAAKMHVANLVDSYTHISGENLQKFQGACHAAIALQLLLKLKRHLKIAYSLNDARCQAFSPNEPLKTGETLSRQSMPLNINEIPIRLPTTYKEMIEKYQDFKASLKEDTVDYSTYTANIRRKRPPPRSSRGGKSVRPPGDDDEDDDDDSEWMSGSRRLSGSVQKSNGGRRSRQRL